MASGRTLIIVAAALSLGASQARAHRWYPAWCCSDHDCRKLLKGEGVTETAEGFRLWDGRFIGREHAKPSPDIKFHICEEPITRAIICFFAPQGQS
jgi:hypothetical protein